MKILLHGLEGNSKGHKAGVLRGCCPDIVIPDFDGDFDTRMAKLDLVLDQHEGQWTIVGSSFGGLMGAVWTTRNPSRVRKLILLAPALLNPEFGEALDRPVTVPVLLFHGTKDTVVPMPPVLDVARKVFVNLQIHTVEDDHRLKTTTEMLDWSRLLS